MVVAANQGSASGAQVTVASRDATAALGVHGLVLSVRGTGALASAGGRVGIQVDYSGFAAAYGAGYGSRLRLVALPACALTSPGVARCRRATAVPTLNDGTGTLSGTVSLAAAAAGQAVAGTARPAVGQAPAMVLGVESGPSGAEGNYAATPLDPAGTWAVQDGDFSYSYPVTAPSSVVGDAPPVSLTYDSQSVDGETSGSNTQGGSIGDGWSYSPGSISMAYEPCSLDTNADPATDSDECWGGSNATLTLNGHSGRLVLNGGSGSTYHLQGDDGTQVQLLTGASNGLWDGQYWLVTTTDGTQYYFGLNHLPGTSSGGVATNSAWGVPVYCPGSSDPCYSSSTGNDSWQTLGWQWNLDYVVSPLGALTKYTYQDETNYYERDAGNANGGTLTEYTKAGYPASVQYGWLLSDAVAGASPQAEVQFASAPRCTSDITPTPPKSPPSSITLCALPTSSSSATDYPDIPLDQICGSSGSCSNDSPTFFTDYMLTGIETEATTGTSSPSLQPVDSWQIGQQFDTAEGSSANSVLALTFIQRTGQDATETGGSLTLPAETFTSEMVDNQVPGSANPPLDRPRLQVIDTEAGAAIALTYQAPNCSQDAENVSGVKVAGGTMSCPQGSGTVDVSASSNTYPAFPVYWSGTEGYPDWFNKSLVSSVTTEDLTGTGTPEETTNYTYLGNAAWHYDENPVIASDDRTWDEFRGYQQVEVTTGQSPDPVTETVDTYMQGMNGDPNGSGGTTSATVAYPSAGPASGDPAVTDSDWLAGQLLESDTYTKAGGTIDEATVYSWPTAFTKTASQSQGSLPALNSYMPTSDESDAMTLQADGSWASNAVTTYYNSNNLPYTKQQAATGSAETCMTTQYATPPSGNSTMESYPERVTTVTGAAAYNSSSSSYECPALSSADAVSDTEYYYDDENDSLTSMGTLGSLAYPGGLRTGEQQATGWSGSTEEFRPSASEYDHYGRILDASDGKGNITQTKYTPAYTAGKTSALPATVTVTNPAGNNSTTNYDQERDLSVQATDINGQVTTDAYDELGRVTAVTLPPDQGQAATYEYSYLLTGNAPPAVTTQTLETSGAYSTSTEIFNGMLDEVETQAPTQGGQAGRVDTYMVYDSDAWVTESDAAFYDNTASPGTKLYTPDLASIPGRTLTTYDGQGRVTAVATWDDNSKVTQTATAYPGMNEADTTPPGGGTATSVFTNALGQKIASWSYDNSTTPDGKSGDADVTSYTYTPAGQVATITDNAGNKWSYGYDLFGELVSSTDPGTTGTSGPNENEGETTSSYDADGNLETSTDPNGTELTYSYDNLDRKTLETATVGGTTSNVAAWSYDSAPMPAATSGKALGQLATSTSYVGSTAYTETVTGYNPDYETTGESTSIPATDGAPAETLATASTYYGLTSQLQSTAYGADGGTYGLPAETVSYGYNALGLLQGIGTSTVNYLDTVGYDATGQVGSATFGADGEQLVQDYTFDQTYPSRLVDASTSVQAEAGGPQDLWSWTYDQAGDVTSTMDQEYDGTTSVTSATTELQCYAYNDLGELTTAWADNGNQNPAPPKLSSSTDPPYTSTSSPGGVGGCVDTVPTSSNMSASATEIGGPAPYWQSYAYDLLGSRTSEVSYDTASVADDTTANETTQASTYPSASGAPTVDTESYDGSQGTAAVATPAAAKATTTTTPDGTITITPGYDHDGNTVSRTESTTGALTSGILPSTGSLCLDDLHDSSAAGAVIDIYTCNNSSAQNWTVAPLSSPASPGKAGSELQIAGGCADVTGNATTSGALIELEPCSTSTAGEVWEANVNGMWVNPNSGMCLTDPGGTTTPGTQLEISSCGTASRTQSWATAAGTGARPFPGTTQQLTYYPNGMTKSITSPAGSGSQTSTYIYDASGALLVDEESSTVTYYGDGGAEELSFTSGVLSSADRFYNQSPDGTLITRAVSDTITNGADTASTPAVYYEVTTPQGTGVEAVNAASDAISRRYYDPYGNRIASAGSWPDNKAYLDQVANSTTGFDLLGARQYSATTGSFLSLDPVLESGSPQQMGGYTYAANNPTTDTDPSGLGIVAPLGACEHGNCKHVKNWDGDGNKGKGLTDIGNGPSSTIQFGPVTLPASFPDASQMEQKWRTFLPNFLSNKANLPPGDLETDEFAALWSMCGDDPSLCGYALIGDLHQAWMGMAAKVGLYEGEQMGGLGAAEAESSGNYADDERFTVAEGYDAVAEEGAADVTLDFLSSCSFAPATLVLLASGKAIPISSLKPGDVVLATNTRTGKTSPEKVTAVEVNHDTNLFDLKVKTARGVEVIHTTSNHLFWDPSRNKWVPAAKLRKGEALKAADGSLATADGGTIPAGHDGWMWDLTIPGNSDHDFYVQASSIDILVHNASCPTSGNNSRASIGKQAHDAFAQFLRQVGGGYDGPETLPSGNRIDGSYTDPATGTKVPVELKPDNDAQWRKGTGQIAGYEQEMGAPPGSGQIWQWSLDPQSNWVFRRVE